MKNFLDTLPTKTKVAIYNSSKIGQVLVELLKKERPDIQIVFFADLFSGEKDNTKIIHYTELYNLKNEFDILLVIANNELNKIVSVLDFYNIKYNLISPNVVTQIKDEYYDAKFYLAKNIFKTQDCKNLYEIIYFARKTGNYDTLIKLLYQKNIFSDGYPGRNYNYHYLEFINKNKIQTIFDCGFCNGIHALSFKKNFKNLQQYYAFEPMYERFKDVDIDTIIKKENFCKIVNLGIWNKKSDNISFSVDLNNNPASRMAEISTHKEYLIPIKTTTIDDFKSENNIENISFIKMDIEGAELQGLAGGLKAICSDRAQLAISIYHSTDDFVDIPIYLKQHLKAYNFYLGHYSQDKNETVLYAIPQEIDENV